MEGNIAFNKLGEYIQICTSIYINIYNVTKYIGGRVVIFSNTIARLAELDIDIVDNGFRVCMFGGGLMLVEGNFTISVFTTENILLKVKKGFINIVGENLALKQVSMGEVIIEGAIRSVSYE